MLCHLVIAPVPNSITPIITLQKKVLTLIGQLLIYYLPMGEWWWKLAPAQSRTHHFLCDYSMLFLPHGLHTKKVRFLNIIIPPVIILQSRDSKDSFPYHWHICVSNVINMCYVQTGCSWQFKISTNYVKPLSPNSSLVFIIHLLYQRFKVLLLGTSSVLWVMDNY